MTLRELSFMTSAQVVIRSRCDGTWYAVVEGAEIGGDGFLRSGMGNGESPSAALGALCNEIRGKRLVFDAYAPHRREFMVPFSVTP